MPDVNPPRSYSSPRRQEDARRTRRAVLEAAAELFVRHGYAGTTMDLVAELAQVSRPTVFAVGSKAELLKLVRDVAMAGDDDPVPVAARAGFSAVLNAPDAKSLLRRFADHVVRLAARYADVDEVLRQAVGADPALRDLWEVSETQRLAGAALVVDAVLSRGRVRGDDRQRAVDVLWLLMAPDQYARMRARGWDDEAYREWLTDTMITQLLPNPQAEA